MRSSLALLVFCLTFSLGSKCQVTPPPVGQEPGDTAACPAACANLRTLGCPEGELLPDGTTCEQFCEKVQKEGHNLNPSCIAKISKCSDADTICGANPNPGGCAGQ